VNPRVYGASWGITEDFKFRKNAKWRLKRSISAFCVDWEVDSDPESDSESADGGDSGDCNGSDVDGERGTASEMVG
jgi:hypothetical protein